jgi:hypothetical protein
VVRVVAAMVAEEVCVAVPVPEVLEELVDQV